MPACGASCVGRVNLADASVQAQFQEKREPVLRPELHQNKELERFFDLWKREPLQSDVRLDRRQFLSWTLYRVGQDGVCPSCTDCRSERDDPYDPPPRGSPRSFRGRTAPADARLPGPSRPPYWSGDEIDVDGLVEGVPGVGHFPDRQDDVVAAFVRQCYRVLCRI